MGETHGQVRVGDEGPTEGNQVCPTGLNRTATALCRVVTGIDDLAAEGLADVLTEGIRQLGGVLPVSLCKR